VQILILRYFQGKLIKCVYLSHQESMFLKSEINNEMKKLLNQILKILH